jgi:hypothetical protein
VVAEEEAGVAVVPVEEQGGEWVAAAGAVAASVQVFAAP